MGGTLTQYTNSIHQDAGAASSGHVYSQVLEDLGCCVEDAEVCSLPKKEASAALCRRVSWSEFPGGLLWLECIKYIGAGRAKEEGKPIIPMDNSSGR